MEKQPNFFDKINGWIRGTEGSIVNLISAIAPWGAPSPVAYMTFDHCLNALHFPDLIAFITALVVEALGISSISTALSFWAHNQKYKGEDQKAPLILAISTFIFYISVVLILNVVIDVEKHIDSNGIIVARALLSLLSIPAGVLLATRAQQTELINSIETQTVITQNKTDEQKILDQQAADKETEKERQRIIDERAEADRQFERQQEINRQIRAEEAAERERMALIEADLKIRRAALRKGIYTESSAKVSETFNNSAAESSDFANFPRNWRKMSHDQKSQLAEYIAQHPKEKVAVDFNVTVRTVENWIVSLTSENYLAQTV